MFLGQTAPTSAAPSYIDTLTAKIQAQVGQFLALKAQIINIENSSQNPQTQQAAQTLYAQQLSAEAAMQAALAAIDTIKTSGISIDAITTITSGITQMEYQISQTKSLQDAFDKETGKSGPISLSDLSGPVVLVIAGLGALYFYKKRR